MPQEQAQVCLTLLSRKKALQISIFVLVTVIISACGSLENNKSFHVVCDSIVVESEIASSVQFFDNMSFSDDVTLNIFLKQDDSDFLLTYNTYQWNLTDQTTINIEPNDVKFQLPCDCKAKLVDESPDGSWQVVDIELIEEDGRLRHTRWLISQNSKYELYDAKNWFWSTDGLYFSFIWATDSPIGRIDLISLTNLESVWSPTPSLEDMGDIPNRFLNPWPISHNITFSPTDKTYWYRGWSAEDQNKIYVYDPIAHEGRIEQIKNIRSAIWNTALEQLMFVKSDDEYITIISKDGLFSAKIPYDLYLEIDGEGWESELTHTNFQVSPEGDYVVFPKHGQLYALECNDE